MIVFVGFKVYVYQKDTSNVKIQRRIIVIIIQNKYLFAFIKVIDICQHLFFVIDRHLKCKSITIPSFPEVNSTHTIYRN